MRIGHSRYLLPKNQMSRDKIPEGFYWSPSRHALAKSCQSCFIRKYVYEQPYDQEYNKAFDYGHKVHDMAEGKDRGAIEEKMVKDGWTLDELNMLQEHVELYDKYAKKLKFSDVDISEHEAVGNIEGLPIPFYGILDRLLVKDKQVYGFVEIKTSAQPWSQTRIETDDQLTWYWTWYRYTYGDEPKAFLLDFVKNKEKPTAICKRIRRTDEDCTRLIAEAKDLHERYVENVKDVEPVCKRTFFCPY